MRPVEKSMGEASALLFGAAPRKLPPLDPKNARAQKSELTAIANANECKRLAVLLESKTEASDFIGSILDLSPFIRDVLMVRPEILDALFDTDIDARIDAIISGIGQLGVRSISEAELMTALRHAKTEAHVLIALGDLAGRICRI